MLQPIKDNLSTGYYRVVMVIGLLIWILLPIIIFQFNDSDGGLIALIVTPICYYILVRLIIWIIQGFRQNN
jgi:hypothetical protein